MTDRLRFFLGGHDLEMVTIADLVRAERGAGAVVDKGLAWGARASAYAAEIAAAVRDGVRPVLVELQADTALPDGAVAVDHHGARAGEPAALRQVFDLLALPPERWTRHFELVALNDVGHVRAMRRFGAGADEIAAIRAADRAAQGVTAAEEAAGLAALAGTEAALGGSLAVVRLPHGRTATVTDPRAIAGDDGDLLVLSPAATHFFGAGDRIARLDAAFPGGWRGGELPHRGFWGIGRPIDSDEAVAAIARG